MNSQIRISDLENIISEKVFIKIEKWNLYLGDAGLARHLAIECISNNHNIDDIFKKNIKRIFHNFKRAWRDSNSRHPDP